MDALKRVVYTALFAVLIILLGLLWEAMTWMGTENVPLLFRITGTAHAETSNALFSRTDSVSAYGSLGSETSRQTESYNRLFGSLAWRVEFPRLIDAKFLPSGEDRKMYAYFIMARDRVGDDVHKADALIYVYFPTNYSSDARAFAFCFIRDAIYAENCWIDAGYRESGVASGAFERYTESVDSFSDLVSMLSWRYPNPGLPQGATVSSKEE